MNAVFNGIWLPMVTPLRGGVVDLDAMQRLHRRYRAAGIDGLVLFGSTGEGNLLTDAEKMAVLEVITSDGDALPVMVGAGGVDTRDVVNQIKRLASFPVHGYLVPPPYYVMPTQKGIVWHYQTILGETQQPVMAYNVPKRTGVAMTAETMARLIERYGIAAVKECRPDALAGASSKLRQRTLCGDDASMLNYLSDGGCGAIPVIANLYPEWVVTLYHLAAQGDSQGASAMFARMQPLIDLLFREPNPVAIKEAMALTGCINSEVRRPLMPAGASLKAALRSVVKSSEGDSASTIEPWAAPADGKIVACLNMPDPSARVLRPL